MGHFVQAFVGTRSTLELIQRQFGVSQVADLPQEMALLPLLNELYDAIPNDEGIGIGIGEPDEFFQFLTPKIVGLLAHISAKAPVGYFETGYFGGDGDQGAILVVKGKITFGPQVGSGSINEMLALMGVDANGVHDEFAAIGLGRFRDNEDWITQPDFCRRAPSAVAPKSVFSWLRRLGKK
jgi:hypothetical protein